MTKLGTPEEFIRDERDYFANLGQDLRGYLFALDSMLEDIPDLGEDGPVADGVGMMINRMNEIADELMCGDTTRFSNKLKSKD